MNSAIDISNLKKKIINTISKYQFKTFLIGIEGVGKSKKIKQELGKLIEIELGKKVDFLNPDLTIIINLNTQEINLNIKSLYIFGRYQKLKPGIPQTRWHKKIYHTSVQEEIGQILLKQTGGSDHSFHGCGREDVDVITLGNGRPFVIEIKNPQKRDLDLKKIEKTINKSSQWVKVKNLKITDKNKIKEIKTASPEKTYLVTVKLEKEVSKIDLLNAAQKLTKIIINQKTPQRVIKRRKNILRKKKIYYFKLKKFDKNVPIFQIKTESGTYIKELVSGDNGRTQPSLAELLKQNCQVKNLKVIKIDY